MRRMIISMLAVSLVFLFLVNLSYPQTRTGSIRGIVTDSEGEFLPGATVELTGEKLMGGGRSIITNNEGKFRFPNLNPGIYEVTVKMEGFQTFKRTALRVISGISHGGCAKVGCLHQYRLRIDGSPPNAPV